MKKLLVLICAATALLSLPAKADRASGGGELIRDKNNPWFVINTKVVHYCVEFDAKHFSKLSWPPEKLIEKAVDYWKKEFAGVESYGPEKTGVATQTFVKEACSNSTDIRFQFGVLHQNQRKYFEDPRQFVSAAIKTDYDRVNLKAKGFVYLAPDSGPLKFETKNKNEKIWEIGNSGTVYKVLKHEMGHVFGIPHIESLQFALMSERYVEDLVSQNTTSDTYELEYHPERIDRSFFVVTPCPKGCFQKLHIRSDTQSFFDLPQNTYEVWALNKGDVIEVYEDLDWDKEIGKNLIGTFKLNFEKKDSKTFGSIPVYLTPKQKVFSKKSLEFSQARLDYFNSAELHQYYVPAQYTSLKTGATRIAVMQYGFEGYSFSGVIDGELQQRILIAY